MKSGVTSGLRWGSHWSSLAYRRIELGCPFGWSLRTFDWLQVPFLIPDLEGLVWPRARELWSLHFSVWIYCLGILRGSALLHQSLSANDDAASQVSRWLYDESYLPFWKCLTQWTGRYSEGKYPQCAGVGARYSKKVVVAKGRSLDLVQSWDSSFLYPTCHAC